MINEKFLKNFHKMNFKSDDIKVALMYSNKQVIIDQPLNNLKIDHSKTLWKLSADQSVFKDVEIKDYFYASIFNKTVDNTIITSTDLQKPPENIINDVIISWNTASGIVQLKKV